MTTSLAVLGSTGSIGTQALDIARDNPEMFRIKSLGASSSVQPLARQAQEFRPDVVALADESKASELAKLLPAGVELLTGPNANAEAALAAETVINGIVGFDGLPVTLATLESGRRLALANKESLIAAGPLVQRVRSTPGAELLPVDSEHCAIHQCLRANSAEPQHSSEPDKINNSEHSKQSTSPASQASPASSHDRQDQVSRIVLTASGGPFRGRTRADLADVTIEDALAHPTWSMGPKITVDSSTLMNKGLEVIEAHELFGLDYGRVEVVVHPQSIVHSMVEFIDGATVAQLSLPDMRLCIGYAISYPARLPQAFGRIDWQELQSLEFEMPDTEAFPCLGLAYEAGRRGETAPAVLNAANEVAVQAFLDGEISWLQISEVIEAALESHRDTPADSVEAVLEADRLARQNAAEHVSRASGCAAEQIAGARQIAESKQITGAKQIAGTKQIAGARR